MAATIDLSSPAIVGRFYDRLEEAFAGSWASAVGWLNPDSTQPTETYKWLGQVPKFREWLGGRNAQGLRVNSFSITNKTWEQTLEFPVEDLRLDKTGQIMQRIDSLAEGGSTFWEDQLVTLIDNAGATACYDGEYFFDSDHPVAQQTPNATTQSNLLTASDYANLNVSTATAPTADEAAKIIVDLVGHFYTIKDDQNRAMNGRARAFKFVAGTVPIWAALQHAISGQNLTSGASNPVAGLLARGLDITAELVPTLSSATTKVRVFRTDGIVKPFILQEQLATEVKIVGVGSEEEFKNNRHLFGTKRIGAAGYGMWQHAIDATLS